MTETNENMLLRHGTHTVGKLVSMVKVKVYFGETYFGKSRKRHVQIHT